MPEQKALFIPLKAEYFDRFKSGEKTEELRLYGPRWNERVCAVGRSVVLSRGYGKRDRLTGRIWKFKRQHGTTFGSTYQAAIQNVFGTLDIWIACISITDIKGVDATHAMGLAARNNRIPLGPIGTVEHADEIPRAGRQ